MMTNESLKQRASLEQGRPRQRQSRGGTRRGATAVEFAIVSPILFLFVIGLLEFGRGVMASQILTNATREGARRAILEQATSSDVQATVSEYLAGATISGATVTVSPSALNKVGFGEPVTVSASVPYDQISWLPSPWFLSGRTLSAQSVMCAERPE